MDPLRAEHLGVPKPGRLTTHPSQRAAALAAHARAVAAGLSAYRDPRTGLAVMTAVYLAGRGWCCGAGCRHCPFE